jgi:hypothetical protein
VHNPHKLETHVLNRYFGHSKFESFKRQLRYHGFQKLAGKGLMTPCSYVNNEGTTNELGSLLLIKVCTACSISRAINSASFSIVFVQLQRRRRRENATRIRMNIPSRDFKLMPIDEVEQSSLRKNPTLLQK